MYHSKQRGITLIGWLFLLTPMAIVLYAGLRIAPIYLNYMKVSKSVDGVAKEMSENANLTAKTVEVALEKRLNIESIEFPEIKDFAVRRNEQVWTIEAKYEDVAPLIANVSLLMQFDKVAEIQ